MKLIDPFPILQINGLGFGIEIVYLPTAHSTKHTIEASINLLVWSGSAQWEF